MDKIIIYGAGNTGKGAYFLLKNKYDCLFFIDSDKKKWYERVEGCPVLPPDVLNTMRDQDVTVMIASIYFKEIKKDLVNMGWTRISIFNSTVNSCLPDNLRKQLDKRTIDLGAFLNNCKSAICKELTFMPGGSQILDYLFLKCIAEKYHCKKYLEIGTYIGESINQLTDCCDVLYSVTAPMDATYSMDRWCRNWNLPCYSDRLTYNSKIKHIYTNSQTYDYSQIDDEIDLYFIDGSHSYNAVYNDTKKIFEMKSEEAIVIWHDFRTARFEYDGDVVRAVSDVLGEKFDNVFVTDRNYCGIYLPGGGMHIKDFTMHELKYEMNAPLYTYDVELKNCQIK